MAVSKPQRIIAKAAGSKYRSTQRIVKPKDPPVKLTEQHRQGEVCEGCGIEMPLTGKCSGCSPE